MRIGVALRPLQAAALRELDAKPYGVLICHRRFGKTVLAVSRLCRNATEAGNSYRGAYIAPFYRQAKDVAWDYLRRLSAEAGRKILQQRGACGSAELAFDRAAVDRDPFQKKRGRRSRHRERSGLLAETFPRFPVWNMWTRILWARAAAPTRLHI